MRILVVGGAGYIGSHVVKELLNTGYDVRVFDNLSTGQEINLFEKAEFIRGDILDVPALEKAMMIAFSDAISLIISRTTYFWFGSRPSVGSSMMSTSGSWMMA